MNIRMKVLSLVFGAGIWVWAFAAHASWGRVYQEKGAIYFEAPSGDRKQIASEGNHREPVLSPDGKIVIFLKRAESSSGNPPQKALADEIWFADTRTARARLLVDEVPGLTRPYPTGSFGVERGSLQFAPDSGSFYFLAKGAGDTDGIVYRVDLRSLTARALTRGRELEVVPAGKCLGYLLVKQRRFFVDGGSYEWSWMYDADGREIGPFQGEFVEISKDEFCAVSTPGIS